MPEPDAYHEGRKPAKQRGDFVPGGPSKQIPEWELFPDWSNLTVLDLVGLKCTRCGGMVGVASSAMSLYAGTTRPCFYCFKVSVIPPHPALGGTDAT